MKNGLIILLVGLVLFGLNQVALAADKLTLDESIGIALIQSPIMLKTQAEIRAAQGQAGQAYAAFLPQVVVEGGTGKYYSEPTTVQITMSGTPAVFSVGTDEQADTTSYSASLSQALFTGGKISNSIRMARRGLIIAQEELDKTAQQVEFDVVNAYYNYIKASKLVLLNGESVNMAQGHLDQVNALLSVGMATKADVLRGEVQLAQAKIGLTKAWQALEIAKNTFNNILGRPLNTPVEIEEAEYPSADVVIYAYPDLLTLAYDGRPDWQQYILGEEIAEDEVRLAYSELWPSISLVGNVERSATKYSAYESDSYNWTALLSGSWTLFDGTANFNKIAEARANLDAKQAEQISVERAIALEVKEANFSLKSAKDNLSLTKTVLDLALENYEMAEQRYKAGVGTSLEEIDAQVALTESRIEYVDAQHALQIAMAKINKVVAGDIY